MPDDEHTFRDGDTQRITVVYREESGKWVPMQHYLTLSEPPDDLPHYTKRMLQALDAYWMWWEGWNGPPSRTPSSLATAEDWWHRFEKYRKRVEELI